MGVLSSLVRECHLSGLQRDFPFCICVRPVLVGMTGVQFETGEEFWACTDLWRCLHVNVGCTVDRMLTFRLLLLLLRFPFF